MFYEALHDNSIVKMMKVPKSDLHNHVGRGGNIQYLSSQSGNNIIPAQEPFNSLIEMQKWFEDNIKSLYPGEKGYLKRVEASFVQAADDNIEILSMSYGMDEITSLGGFLADNKIQLNLCPTSNVMLKRVDSYANYQIKKLIDYGITVTINTDDLLIFNSSISQEYLKLYNAKVLTDLELNIIGENGLNDYNQGKPL